MAWRLDKSVIRGEIDNRKRGVIRGRLWLLNRPEPIELDLKGDCHRDMAGSLLTFENPQPDEGGNCLYLEWFSDFNGRVVIESVDYKLTVSAPAWSMDEEEEKAQREENRQAMGDWMHKLEEARDRRWEENYDPEDDKPMDEFEWEKFLKESDVRTDPERPLRDPRGDA